MMKRVVYNGGKESYYTCSDPSALVVGKEYEVIAEKDRAWQTDYSLKGVEGEFNSIWFNEVCSGDKVYMALSHWVPIVGERCLCSKVEFIDGKPKLFGMSTSIVKEVSLLGNNIYRVETQNSVYIVQVG